MHHVQSEGFFEVREEGLFQAKNGILEGQSTGGIVGSPCKEDSYFFIMKEMMGGESTNIPSSTGGMQADHYHSI